jgi:hypothetical protein
LEVTCCAQRRLRWATVDHAGASRAKTLDDTLLDDAECADARPGETGKHGHAEPAGPQPALACGFGCGSTADVEHLDLLLAAGPGAQAGAGLAVPVRPRGPHGADQLEQLRVARPRAHTRPQIHAVGRE